MLMCLILENGPIVKPSSGSSSQLVVQSTNPCVSPSVIRQMNHVFIPSGVKLPPASVSHSASEPTPAIFLRWQHCRHLEVVPSQHSWPANPGASPSVYKSLYGPPAEGTTHLSTTNTNYRLSKVHCLSIVHLTQPLSWLTGELESNKINQQTMHLLQQLS